MKYKTINGKKYLIDTKGNFIKDAEGNQVEVSDTQAETMEEVVAPADEAGEAEISDEAAKGLKNFISKTVKTQVETAVNSVKALNNLDKTVGEAIASVFKGENSEKGLSFEVAGKSVSAKEVLAGMSAMKAANKKAATFEFEVKTLSELNSLTGNVILEDRRPEITRAPISAVYVSDYANRSATNSNKITYVEAITETGAPATTEELAKFPEEDKEFGTFEATVKKIAVYQKASNEILEDAPQLVNLCQTWLREDILRKADEKILSGTGVANEFTGILTIAPTWAAGTFASTGVNTIQDPNKFDVLRVGIENIRSASKSRYMPNVIFVAPVHKTSMELTKDANGNYVMPPFVASDKTTISGVQIVELPDLAAGKFLIGDFRRANLAEKRGLTIQLATENEDDFLKDIITVRGSMRFAFYVKNNDIGAFCQGDFATALTAL